MPAKRGTRAHNGQKKCSHCLVVKTVDQFYKASSAPDGLHNMCKVCKTESLNKSYSKNHRKQLLRNKTPEGRARGREYRRQYVLRHPREVRDSYLKRAFGIGIDDYDTLFARQDGECAVCGKKFTGPGDYKLKGAPNGVPRVDHDHATGNVRGLLCQHCNVGLGMFNDDPELLSAALAYLARLR